MKPHCSEREKFKEDTICQLIQMVKGSGSCKQLTKNVDAGKNLRTGEKAMKVIFKTKPDIQEVQEKSKHE